MTETVMPTSSTIDALRTEIRRIADPKRAAINRKYFKTAPGEYGSGDEFVGLTVPQVRTLSTKFGDLSLHDAEVLVRSKLHEERLLGLTLFVARFEKGDEPERRSVYRLYVKLFPYVNNWDLVDGSAPSIVGGWLDGRNKAPLESWARSPRLWDRRIAMIATQAWIRKGEFTETFRLARLLLRDPEDLIHKATGWMLREIGNRDLPALERFLKRHKTAMPRTMLRYAIEKFPAAKRKSYMAGGK